MEGATATVPDRKQTAVASWVEETPWRRVAKVGLLAGATGIYVATIGMPVAFDDRMIIDPILSMGYLALLWIPLVFGYQATHRPVLEGVEAPRQGAGNVVGGALAGLIGGLMMAGYVVFIDTFDVRDVFINISPDLVDLLTFGRGVGFGILVMIVGGVGLGGFGGLFHVMPLRLRKAVISGAVWVLLIAFMELVLTQILNELPGLGSIEDFIYASGGGVTVVAAIVIYVLGFAGSWYLAPRRGRLRRRVARLPEERRRLWGTVAALVGLAVALFLPTILGTLNNEILTNVGLFMLMALGLNIVVGYAGLLDLGYVAFFAVGAYTTAVLTSPGSPQFSPELTFWQALPFVVVAAIIAGIFVGTPVIRMRGDYLAIVTLAFGEIARVLLVSDWFKPVLGGAQGILSIPSITIPAWAVTLGLAAAAAVLVYVIAKVVWGFSATRAAPAGGPGTARAPERPGRNYRIGVGVLVAIAGLAGAYLGASIGDVVIRGTDPQSMVYIIGFFVLIAVFVSWRLESSRIGRSWMAMREDEQVAQVMGVNIVTGKLLAFVTGAILASFAGALFAAKIGSIFPSSFNLLISIVILVVVIVGGMGSIPGVMIGALVLIGILGGPTNPGLLREFEEYKLLIYGVLLVYMMLKRPEGLVPSKRVARELHQEELVQDAWLKAEGAIESDEA